ncbi:MAG: hypothetical protein GXP31_11815 [Kiritimatiellaeota bacterium]|nr:hypothetical protein [Kiritimatiellota bacterium]
MANNSLPDPFRGEWIWSRSARGRLDAYVFFRKDITLDAAPQTADLWITAGTFFHVYINGRHLAYGPPPCTGPHFYVLHLEAADLLAPGQNVLAVLAHNVGVTHYGGRRRDPGLWCQLNVDGAPVAWTDHTWVVHAGHCYATNRPRRSRAFGFTEEVQLSQYPARWQEKDFNAVHWRHADDRTGLAETRGGLRPLNLPDAITHTEPFDQLTLRGVCGPVAAVTHITCADRAHSAGPGVYVAETFVYSAEEGQIPFELHTDDPYRFFVNGTLVKSQGEAPLPAGADLDRVRPACFGQAGRTEVDGEMTWRQGWNRLVLFQLYEPDSNGATLVFPTLQAESTRFVRAQARDDAPGWTIAGPLRATLGAVTGAISSHDLRRSPYIPIPGEPVNEGALLLSYGFRAETRPGEVPSRLELKQNEYAILDLGRTVSGCPELTVSGPENGALDIVCGELLVGDQLLPCQPGGRNNTDTLLLGDHPCRWSACTPRGFRYLMLVARRAVGGPIIIENPGVITNARTGEPSGRFESSDALFNELWQTGVRTLRATAADRFVDSPCRDNAQYLADALIQSWAAYHVFGAFSLGAKGLAEFANSQFETGEMPALAPSDIYLNMPDYSLLWVSWLRRHYLYTGDIDFLREMAPALDKLFAYFSTISVHGREILADLDRNFGAYCFLDHGDIDRRGAVTGLNALYCRALLAGAWLAEQLGDARQADTLHRRAARVAHYMRELCWDAERGLFADGWHGDGMSEFYSWQTNVLALYGSIARPEHGQVIFDKLFRKQAPLEPLATPEHSNPYFQFFVLETAFALGRDGWAFDLIRWYWGAMAARGARTWWELFDPESNDTDEDTDISRCHGYGASVNAFLATRLVGVRPVAPGFTRVYFNPFLPGAEWVKAEVPTPYGRIAVEWRLAGDGQLEANIDANYPLEVIPLLDPKVAESATVHVSDDVTILAQEPA